MPLPKLTAAGVRRGLLFCGGMVGMVFEATHPEPRAILVGAYLLALGLPVFQGLGALFQQPPAPPAPPVDPLKSEDRT